MLPLIFFSFFFSLLPLPTHTASTELLLLIFPSNPNGLDSDNGMGLVRIIFQVGPPAKK